MIPFNEIDKRLDALGENRAWLAEVTGRSPDSLRTALAPNAPASKRTALLQRALSDAIEREEDLRKVRPTLPDRITLEALPEEVRAWGQAAGAASLSTHDWAVRELNEAADAWTEGNDLKSLPPPKTRHRKNGA